MNSLLIASAAEAEYTSSLQWYAERSVAAAEGFEKAFAAALRAIQSKPELYPYCDTTHRYYLLKRYPFQVIYRQVGEDWIVIAVAHTSRRPNYWSER